MMWQVSWAPPWPTPTEPDPLNCIFNRLPCHPSNHRGRRAALEGGPAAGATRQKVPRHLRLVWDLVDAFLGIKERAGTNLERNPSQMQPSFERMSAPTSWLFLAQHAVPTPSEWNELQVWMVSLFIFPTRPFTFFKRGNLRKHGGQRSFATFQCNYWRMLIPTPKWKNLQSTTKYL